MRKSKLMRGLLATSGALFGALMVGTQIASTYNSWINTQLSVTNWQVVTPAGEDPEDYIYWKSDYSKLEDDLLEEDSNLEENIEHYEAIVLYVR